MSPKHVKVALFSCLKASHRHFFKHCSPRFQARIRSFCSQREIAIHATLSANPVEIALLIFRVATKKNPREFNWESTGAKKSGFQQRVFLEKPVSRTRRQKSPKDMDQTVHLAVGERVMAAKEATFCENVISERQQHEFGNDYQLCG